MNNDKIEAVLRVLRAALQQDINQKVASEIVAMAIAMLEKEKGQLV